MKRLPKAGDGSPLGIERAPDDLMFLYTGGTTGMPKGVMWSHQIWRDANLDGMRRIYGAAPETWEDHRAFVKEVGQHGRQLPRLSAYARHRTCSRRLARF